MICEFLPTEFPHEWVQALSDVHERRSHRDLKAGNVMVSGWDTAQLKIYLIDWANSRKHSEGVAPP